MHETLKQPFEVKANSASTVTTAGYITSQIFTWLSFHIYISLPLTISLDSLRTPEHVYDLFGGPIASVLQQPRFSSQKMLGRPRLRLFYVDKTKGDQPCMTWRDDVNKIFQVSDALKSMPPTDTWNTRAWIRCKLHRSRSLNYIGSNIATCASIPYVIFQQIRCRLFVQFMKSVCFVLASYLYRNDSNHRIRLLIRAI